MKTSSNKRTLEAYKIFPYIAWALTLGFTLFVYNIAMDLKVVAQQLEIQTQFLQERAHTPLDQITNFNKPTTTVDKR